MIAAVALISGYLYRQKPSSSFTEPPSAPPSSMKTPVEKPNAEPSITLRIDFGDGTLGKNYELLITNYEEGETLWSVMQQMLVEKDIALDYENYGEGLGALITKIGDKKNGDEGRYWQYFVNGEYAKVGVSNYKVNAGDIVEWKFTNNKF